MTQGREDGRLKQTLAISKDATINEFDYYNENKIEYMHVHSRLCCCLRRKVQDFPYAMGNWILTAEMVNPSCLWRSIATVPRLQTQYQCRIHPRSPDIHTTDPICNGLSVRPSSAIRFWDYNELSHPCIFCIFFSGLNSASCWNQSWRWHRYTMATLCTH